MYSSGCIEDIGTGERNRREWNSTALKYYSGDVPEFALQRALTIKEAHPTANFEVCYLNEVTDRKERPLPDPFLVVNAPGESYYIDVWDEKKYEDTLFG